MKLHLLNLKAILLIKTIYTETSNDIYY